MPGDGLPLRRNYQRLGVIGEFDACFLDGILASDEVLGRDASEWRVSDRTLSRMVKHAGDAPLSLFRGWKRSRSEEVEYHRFPVRSAVNDMKKGPPDSIAVAEKLAYDGHKTSRTLNLWHFRTAKWRGN